MKKTNRILAILLAALLLVGVMATGAMAATAIEEEGSVKITNAVAGSEYKFYRVLDIDGISADGKSTFITNASWNDKMRSFNLGFGTFNGTGVGASVTINDTFSKPEDAQKLAKAVYDAANETPGIQADRTVEITASGENEISGLQYGFYVMVSTRAATSDNAKYTVFTINSKTPLSITEKNDQVPNIRKTVNGEDAVDADFNSELNYVITVGAAAGTDTYIISDTMPTEIVYKTGSLTLELKKVGGTTATPLTEDTHYTLTEGTDFPIKLTDDFRKTLADNDQIIISYTGTLTATENTLTANPYVNGAKLTYGDNSEKNITNEASVYSSNVGFYKKDNGGNYLGGAKFVLKNENGKFAALEGSGTTYRFSKWVDSVDEATKITTEQDNTNEILIRGLKSGTYTLVETEAPDGYIKGEDAEVKITKIWKENENKVLVLNGLTPASVTVTNTLGSNLPETGGIGTTIFYIAGGILVLCALALVVVKRKKAE